MLLYFSTYDAKIGKLELGGLLVKHHNAAAVLMCLNLNSLIFLDSFFMTNSRGVLELITIHSSQKLSIYQA
jgi:hypothetical protein